jgi:hypothetical protein
MEANLDCSLISRSRIRGLLYQIVAVVRSALRAGLKRLRFARHMTLEALPHRGPAARWLDQRPADKATRREASVIGRALVLWAVTGIIWISAILPCRGEEDDLAELAKALPKATISIGLALKLSEFAGNPISAEYEIQSGTLLLSVFTMKADQLYEVIIDAKSGSLEQVEPLTDSEEVEDAKDQSATMAKAKNPLDIAVGAAENENSGYRAVSVMPMLNGGVPVAAIILMSGEGIKRVAQKLD